jgi:ElaB/YqjD/DUF883 family membrane-anchored ribosome-binding protein
MTVLGEAFIEVKGDLRPFIRDLHRELDTVVDTFEKRLKGSLTDSLHDMGAKGEETGERLGDGVHSGFKKKFSKQNQPTWLLITAAFASALDDGISALPMQVKAAIVFGVLAALPLLSGALAGLLTATVGAAVAGIGAFIAFQYDEVRERGKSLVDKLRLMFVDIASPFVPAMLNAMDKVEDRFDLWVPMLARIFKEAATFIDPLTDGLLDLLQGILVGIEQSFGETGAFVHELAEALDTLGQAIGQTLRILADTGDSGREAFRDFIYLIGQLLIVLATMIAMLTEVYHILRLTADFVNPFFAIFAEGADRAAGATSILVSRNHELERSTAGVIKLTDEEAKRLKELEKSLKDASDATYGIVQSQVDFQRSLDDIRESLKENGRTLDINKEKGRENVESFLKGLKDAQKETEAQVAIGKLNAQQAAEHYNLQILAIQKLAREAGITNQQFENMFGDIIAVAQLKLDAEAMGLTNTTDELAAGVNQAAELYAQLQRIRNFRLPDKGTRPFSEYAEGGIVTQPTQALIGEAGPEVVIPLTRPSRAAQLMEKSGLAGMLSAAATLVQVFIGNEQLEGRMVQVVEKNNAALGNSLAFGARGL